MAVLGGHLCDRLMSYVELQFCDSNIVPVIMLAFPNNDCDKPTSNMTDKLFGELLCICRRSNLSVIQWHLAGRLGLLIS